MERSRQRILPLAVSLALSVLWVLAMAVDADARRAGLRLAEVARFDQPTFVGAPDGAGEIAYVTEREGRIRILAGAVRSWHAPLRRLMRGRDGPAVRRLPS